jgi:hypothetical protein
LVGETMKRTSEAVQRRPKGEEGVGERRSDEFAGVGGNITTLVVTVSYANEYRDAGQHDSETPYLWMVR